MSKGHEGTVDLRVRFSLAFQRLGKDSVKLLTTNGTQFEASAAVSRAGDKVIRFKQLGKEYGRSYECCWGHYHNCSGTRIGMYCRALDEWAKS